MSLISRFFSTLYLSVMIIGKQCLIYSVAMRGGKFVKSVKVAFDNNNPHVLSPKITDYIKRLQKEYKWVYIALFFDAASQGALRYADQDELVEFGLENKNFSAIPITPNWLIYAQTSSITQALIKFNPGDIDLLYSPLALLHRAAITHEQDVSNTLYIYNEKECFALCIRVDGEFRLGLFVKIDEHGREQNIYEHVVLALEEFYAHEAKDSDFIERAAIFNASEFDANLIRRMESELLIKTTIYEVDTLALMSEMMIDEVNI